MLEVNEVGKPSKLELNVKNIDKLDVKVAKLEELCMMQKLLGFSKVRKLTKLGRSVYVQGNGVNLPAGAEGMPVFLSLHIPEEYGADFVAKVTRLCDELQARGCQLMVDVSKETLQVFDVPDFVTLAEKLHLYMLRLDDGFSLAEMVELAGQLPICLNASILSMEEAVLLAQEGKRVFAMHNFYPRPETGLDTETFMEKTKMLQAAGLAVAAFIPGTTKRGPLFDGLPTLEAHRYAHHYLAWAELCLRYGVDQVYVGDLDLEPEVAQWIADSAETGVLRIPCTLRDEYSGLYNIVFSNRADAPKPLIRLAEGRTAVTAALKLPKQPINTVVRQRGVITMDNEKYLRYCGELQLPRVDLPADEKVNVIGQVVEEWLPLLDLIGPKQKLMLVPVSK